MPNIKDIREKNLISSLNDDVFDQVKDNNEVPFLSSFSIKSIENYSDILSEEQREGKKLEKLKIDNLKEIWKNLLIDSICFLKVNDTREKYNKTAKKISQDHNFRKKFDDNRKLSSYGIDDLANYFDAFINFETVLYGSEKYYRDHVEHVIQVWGIGLSLLRHNKFILADSVEIVDKMNSFEIEDNVVYGTDSSIKNQPYEKNLFITKGELFAIWTIVALTHDLGYPIEKSYKINEKLKNILFYFGNLSIDEFSYNFNLFNNYLVEKFLNIISSKATTKKVDKTYNKFGYTLIQSKYRDKISKSLEDYKHGVFSSLLLFKSLTYFLETDYSYDAQDLSFEDLRQFFIRKEILRAIAGHTCPKLYHLSLNTIPFLLILCDELQEWGRPRFEDLKVGYIEEKPTEIKILKFESNEVEARISYTCSKSELDNLKKREQNKHKETDAYKKYEEQVIRKFQMFHHLLRSAKDDKNRTFIFTLSIDISSDNDGIIYRFKFNSTIDDAFEVLKTQLLNKNKPLNDEHGNFTDYEEIAYIHMYL
jgi:hypothetical protein